MDQSDRNAIIDAAMKKTAEEFATEVAKRTVLSVKEVLDLAKSDEERLALAKVVAVVTDATTTNTAKANTVKATVGGIEALVRIAGLVL